MIFLWVLVALVLLFGLTAFVGAPYVPTRRKDIRSAFEDLYPLGNQDVVLDIGSGDGVVLRVAASYGAKAIGYEINPLLVLISRWLSRGNSHIRTELKNFWRSDFPADATVVYVFGESRDIARMATRIQQQANNLSRTLHVVSYGFKIPGKAELASTKSHHLYAFRPANAIITT